MDNIVDFILGEIPKMGAGWCPPGVLGIGIGGTADKAMVMAKESLFDTIDIQELIKKRQHHKKLTLKQRKQLDEALFVNYCSCIKSLKYDSKVKDYLEYPVCMSSIYKKRGFKPPKGVTVRCGKYK